MALFNSANQKISLMLAQVLEDIGVTKEMIDRRRKTFLEKEAIMNLSEMLLGLKTISFHFGSQVEATTTLGMNSDIDSLRYMNDRPVILTFEDWKAGKKNLLMLTDQYSPPQHCYLQRLSEDVPKPLSTLPSLDHEKDNNGRVLIRNTFFSRPAQRFTARSGRKHVEHGPSLSHSEMVDYVFCFHCKNVPEACSSWIRRHRSAHWPTENVKAAAQNEGIFLLPLGHPHSDNATVEWRFSTSAAERLLMFSLNVCQIKVYILLKMIRKTYIKKAVGDRLSSYHMKTALLYTIENSNPDIWNDANLLLCTMYCLITLARWLHWNYIPHFTIEDVNLLTGKLKTHELPALEDMLWDIMFNLKCVLGIGMDSAGDRLWALIHNPYLGRCIRGQFSSRSEIQYNIVAELAEQYFGFINQSFNHILVSANKASFDQANKVVEKNISILSTGLLHPDRIKRDALRLFIKFLSSISGTLQVSLCLRQELPVILPGLFNLSMGLDSASCKLKLASVYYCIKDYQNAASLLEKVELSFQFQPYTSSACDCRTWRKPPKTFCRRTLTSSNQDILKSCVTFCVKFSRHEKECVPKHLQFEMYRASGCKDFQLRDLWHDTWMDLAVIDSLPFMYYLQYLTYRELGLEDARVNAVEKLGAYVDENNGYGHIETACNLIGHCFELEGMFNQAIEWYLESLQALPKNNAALWHIILLLHSQYKSRIVGGS